MEDDREENFSKSKWLRPAAATDEKRWDRQTQTQTQCPAQPIHHHCSILCTWEQPNSSHLSCSCCLVAKAIPSISKSHINSNAGTNSSQKQADMIKKQVTSPACSQTDYPANYFVHIQGMNEVSWDSTQIPQPGETQRYPEAEKTKQQNK